MLYISWVKNGKSHKIGPYYTASLDGFDIFNQEWFCYEVQTLPGVFHKVQVPRYHSFSSVK